MVNIAIAVLLVTGEIPAHDVTVVVVVVVVVVTVVVVVVEV